jgi:hypothetical protein
MFRSKRIEKLMEEFVAIEKRVEEIVKEQRGYYLSDRLMNGLPWKCKKPDCTVDYWHIHTISESSPASGGTVDGS